MSITDIVADWGGFEHFVAELHETGQVTVDIMSCCRDGLGQHDK